MKNLRITVNGTAYDVQVEELGAGSAPAVASAPAPKTAPAPKAAAPAGGEGSIKVNSPMPGTIVSIAVSQGQAVKKGDTLVVIEAMKMENEIAAPEDGTVASINCTKGESVDSGKLLVSLN